VVPAIKKLLFLSRSTHQIRSMNRVGSLQRLNGKMKITPLKRKKNAHLSRGAAGTEA
jgi:hypothetical protein